MLTKADEGGGGVSQMLTIADGGGRGGPGTPDFGWRNMWTAPKSKTFQELYKGSGQGEDVETIARLRAEMLEQERQVEKWKTK